MRVPMRGTGAERPVVAEKPGKPEGAKGSRHSACIDGQPRKREEPPSQAKPYSISKMAVWEAYKRVKANGGAAGVDSESIEESKTNSSSFAQSSIKPNGCHARKNCSWSPLTYKR